MDKTKQDAMRKKIQDEYDSKIAELKEKYGNTVIYSGQNKFRWGVNSKMSGNPKRWDKVPTTSRRWAKGAFTE